MFLRQPKEYEMNFSTIMNHFTKSKLQELLDNLKDTTYRSSWKKEKLISHLCEYDSKSVLNKLTTTQLKEILQENNLPTNGKKSDLIERLLNGESGPEALGSVTDSTDSDMSDEELLEFGELLYCLYTEEGTEEVDDEKFQEFVEGYQCSQKYAMSLRSWKYVGIEYDIVDVINHRSYAAYNVYFVNGDDGLVIGCNEKCGEQKIFSAKRVRVSKKKVTVYCFDDHVSTLR